MGCANKFVLFVTNFIVFAVGVAVVTLASIVISKDNTYGVLLKEGTISLPIVVLIIGLSILVIGFLGCCGAAQENTCLLYIYATIVLVLLIAEVIMGILMLVYTNKADDLVKESMTHVFNDYGGSDKSLTKAVDKAQQKLKCCGVNNYTDWANFTYGENNPDSLGDGCCKGNFTEGCGKNILKQEDFEDHIYTEGCYTALKDDIKGAAIGLGVTCLILAAVQAFSIMFACQLAKEH